MASPIEKSLLPADNQVLTVTDLTRRIKKLLETYTPEVWVRGEISNFRRHTSGHCYFTLKDEASQVDAVVFREDANRLRLDLRDGLQVTAFGRVTVYERRGNYQLIIRFAAETGRGKLREEFERLKQKLAAEGLFAPDRKKALPKFPRAAGFVTSPTGAAVRDFIGILRRRRWKGRLVVIPARVQGEEAAGEIAAMINAAEKLGFLDVLAVGRGGGSLEDLQPFNEEKVVRAVAACSLPVISAVGHEIDFTLCDFAADARAETPSAAAELIAETYRNVLENLQNAATSILYLGGEKLHNKRSRLESIRSRHRQQTPVHQIEQSSLRLDDLSNRLRAALVQGVHCSQRRFNEAAAALRAISPEARLRFTSRHVGQLAKRLLNASPQQVLRRGYVIIKDKENRVIPRKKSLRPGQKVKTQFHDGEASAEVLET